VLTGVVKRERSSIVMPERPRLLMLDMLESFARERDIEVHLERRSQPHGWICLLSHGPEVWRGSGPSARTAIRAALQQAGVNLEDP
jgi:hypothetical protein